MGGFANYVWPAYGLAAVILIGNLWLSARQLRRQQNKTTKEVKHESFA